MMHHEFEELAGYEVSYEDYINIIEPMYMATSLSKQDFIACIDRKRFALKTRKELISEMRKVAKTIMENTDITGAYKEKDKLQDLCRQFAKRCGWDSFFDRVMYSCIEWKRGCSFPVQVVFYNANRPYGVDETIDLLPKMIKDYGYIYNIEPTK